MCYRLTSFGLLVIKRSTSFHSDLKVVLVVAASLERCTALLGLNDLNHSAIFKFCFEYF